jgi:hypothetical protein
MPIKSIAIVMRPGKSTTWEVITHTVRLTSHWEKSTNNITYRVLHRYFSKKAVPNENIENNLEYSMELKRN